MNKATKSIRETVEAEIEKQGPDTYICDRCHGEFEYGWSKEEAIAEAQKLWTSDELNQAAIVCDDCFKIVMGN